MRSLVAALSLVVIVTSLVGLFVGCATDEPNVPVLTRSDLPPRRRAPDDSPVEELVAERIDIGGTVVTDVEGGSSRREVVLVDARGERRDAITDDAGRFAIHAVSAPYDITVVPFPSGAAMVYLGLRRTDPHVELFERNALVPVATNQIVRAGVRLGNTPCSTSSGWVTAVTTSASGSGSTLTPCRPGDDAVVVDVEHGWRGAAVIAGERIDLHVLVGDDEGSSFAYTRIGDVIAAPGETTDAGDVDPAPIGVTRPVTVGVGRGTAALADWRWTTSVSLDLSGEPRGTGQGFVFAMAPAASMRLSLPLIPGATMRASVFGLHPRADGQGSFFRSTEAWSDRLALPSAPVEIDVAPGPEIVRPTEGGTLSRRGLGFEWGAGPATADSVEATLGVPTLAILSFADATTGAVVFRALTSELAIPLERLGALGVGKLDVGAHWVDLASSPGVDVDDATSPDVAVRHGRFERTRGGVATFLRVPFKVTE